MPKKLNRTPPLTVALRKESVDRNTYRRVLDTFLVVVALRKESVDRNNIVTDTPAFELLVALRKESVDRNLGTMQIKIVKMQSLSARRAWIEIILFVNLRVMNGSLSARRAWIEIF